MGFRCCRQVAIGLPARPRGRSSVAHLTGATDDRAINLGAFNAPTPPKSRDSDLPRKEVIQPHLPVRLPCYDFVPIAGPTFDRSPHTRWLGHGLRVLPTFVT